MTRIAVVYALTIVLMTEMLGVSQIQSVHPVMTHNIHLVAARAATQEKVTPLVKVRWWGLEIRLTKLQTRSVATLGSAAIAGIPGIAATAVAWMSAGLAVAADAATSHDKCAGINVTWAALVIGTPMWAKFEVMTYNC